METSFFDTNFYSYVVIPFLIFFARICDMSLDTLRIIFVSKGKKNMAPILGFFEILIWLMAITKIMQNLDHYINYIAYAAGFATGNLIGMIIEEKLAMGIQMIRVFTNERGMELVKILNSNGFGATAIEAHGALEQIHLIYTIINRNELGKVIELINEFNPKAFYTIEDVKAVNEGIFSERKHKRAYPFSNILSEWKKRR